jgi:hypothetical protein
MFGWVTSDVKPGFEGKKFNVDDAMRRLEEIKKEEKEKQHEQARNIMALESKLHKVESELEIAKILAENLIYHKENDELFPTKLIQFRQARLNKNDDVEMVICERFGKTPLICKQDEAIQLRDFLLKHFPVNEVDIEKPEVSE